MFHLDIIVSLINNILLYLGILVFYINNVLIFKMWSFFVLTVQYKLEEFGNYSKELRKCEAMQIAAYGPRPPKEKEDKDKIDEGISI